MRLQLPRSSKNWLSILGVTIALVSLLLILFLWIISFSSKSNGAYLGLINYIILPSILILGLFLIPVGMLKNKKKIGEEAWPKIDLNDSPHRNAFFIFITGSIILIFLSAIGSYEAFHITESVEFCGKLCHEVMNPEFIAYQNSPHARVACVECHVGSGADWYARSKLSGIYQVYSVLFNKYPKPIDTPIQNLRPAREICERCHWPQKIYSQKLDNRIYFLADEHNSAWKIQLVLKTGSALSAHKLSEGIHWHINPDIKVEYLTSDNKRQDITWVRTIDARTSDTLVYIADEVENIEEIQVKETIRTMDCIDCHNRPSHNFKAPSAFINHAFQKGKISSDLPQFKSLAMEICEEEFMDTSSALLEIQQRILQFYKKNYPNQPQAKLDKAIRGFQEVYSKNISPEMKVRWNVHVNNIGHLNNKGCFRCHDGLHVTESGETISNDCVTCHNINLQGKADNPEYAIFGQSLEFKHPVDIDEEWKETLCSECHAGLSP